MASARTSAAASGQPTLKAQKKEKKAWIISVDMGYGHQRAAYPLKDLAEERIITANNDKLISEKERSIWERTREMYEFISRMKHIPLLGKILFGIMDTAGSISPFFPFRDLSKPNFSVLRLKKLIVKKGLCQSLISYTMKEDIPIVTTFFVPALAYSYAGKQVYCVVTDSDINRVWVTDDPKTSTIIYFSPCRHATLRLQEYGVPPERVIETGFPLPLENIGSEKGQEILKKDLLARLINLDPQGMFFQKYGSMVKDKLGLSSKIVMTQDGLKRYRTHPLTISYLIGGSGAQADIGMDIIRALRERILKGDIRINITAGTKLDVKAYYERELAKEGLSEQVGEGKAIAIVFALDKKAYFEAMNQALRTTDIIWTKPSEMSFYTALGFPIIIAPPIGAHENFNMQWLEHIGSGFVQEDPKFTHQWLIYWLEDGRLADAAMQGFIDAPALGAYKIANHLFSQQEK